MEDPINLIDNLRDEHRVFGVIALDAPRESQQIVIMVDQMILKNRHVLALVLLYNARVHSQKSRLFILHG